MNVLIVNTNRTLTPGPVLPSGACLVAEAAERAGHCVKLIDLTFEREPLRTVRDTLRADRYDAIGLSIRNIDNNDMQATRFFIGELPPLMGMVRAFSKAPVILGGAAIPVMPEEIMRRLGVDGAVISGGAGTFNGILEKMAAGAEYAGIPGVASVNGTFRVTPASPNPCTECSAPDYGRWVDLAAYRSLLSTVPLQTKLGCPFQCVYCTYNRIEGHAFRLFDPESAADIALRIAASGCIDIEFVDNVFNLPADHAHAVCESFIKAEVGARLHTVEVNPTGLDSELLRTMERAGFAGIGLTVESASDEVLKTMKKGFTAGDVRRAAETVGRHSLPCIWIFLLGGPGETRRTAQETLKFAATSIRPTDAAFFNVGIRIYPDTELESLARKQGVLNVPRERMLEPVFYVSPEVDRVWLRQQVAGALVRNMNFMSVDAFAVRYVPFIQRTAYRLGLKPPLWRYTRQLRRALRSFGAKV